MVKVRLNHTVHRYFYNGKHYYPGETVEVTEQDVTSYMTVLPEITYVTPIIEVEAAPVAEQVEPKPAVLKHQRKRKAATE